MTEAREQIQKRIIDALVVADCVADPAELGDTEEEFWNFMVGKAVMPVIDDLRSELDRLFGEIKTAHEGMKTLAACQDHALSICDAIDTVSALAKHRDVAAEIRAALTGQEKP